MGEEYSILVVDDNADYLKVLRDELGQEGFTVFSALSGEAGLNLLRQQHVDLVLLDILLPEMDGFEVLKVIKKEFPATKVVMITAHSDVYHAMEARRLGADDFIGKPYDISEIHSAINRLR